MHRTRPLLQALLPGVLLTGALLAGSAPALAQPLSDPFFQSQAQPAIPDIEYDPGGEFNFVRVQFDTWQGGWLRLGLEEGVRQGLCQCRG